MAEVIKVIELSDGTLTNLVDNSSKLSVNYKPVTTWYDGTPMTNAKVDGELYRRKGSKYYRKVIDKDGELFLEKDTMAQMRALTAREILYLKAGVYKGVTLNGYYAEGDTPTSIDYYISDTAEDDDGGSVISSGGIKLEHKFLGLVHSSYFGITETDSSNINNFTKYISNKSFVKAKIQKTTLSGTITISNSPNLELEFEDLSIQGYRGVNVVNSPSSYLFGKIDGGSISVVALTIKNSKNVDCWVNVYNVGNETVNQVRGVEFLGDCSNSTYVGEIDNLISSSVASGVSFNINEEEYSRNTTVMNSRFSNIYPSADSDGVKYLQLGKENNSLITNCYFLNTSKRGVKLQGRFNKVINCHFEGKMSTACVDAQDGDTDVINCTSKLTDSHFTFVYTQNGGLSVDGCDFRADKSGATTASSAVRITQSVWAEDYKSDIIKISNSNFEGTYYPIRFVKTDYSPKYNVTLRNLDLNNFDSPYAVQLSGCDLSNLTVYNIRPRNTPSPYYSILGGMLEGQIIDNADIGNNTGRAVDGALANQKNNKNIKIEFSNAPVNRVRVIQDGGRRIIVTDVSSIADSRLTPYLIQSSIGDILWMNPNSGIVLYACTVAGDGVSNIGTWKALRLFDQSASQTNITQADLATITSPNATSDTASEATDVAGVVTDLNDLITRYNVIVTLVNELKDKYNTQNVPLTNANKASQNTELTNQRTAGQQAT